VTTKTSRVDLRLTDDQREVIELAAALSGSTLTGWAVPCLVDVATRQIAATRTTVIPDEQWQRFVDALDAPDDPRTTELLARAPVWAVQ